jgi:hypothetical protein
MVMKPDLTSRNLLIHGDKVMNGVIIANFLGKSSTFGGWVAARG